MSAKNIERLALVAKNASLALGIAMPDALNRLSRGIVKLEPELLDELGLFTKIGPATEKYALELGKSTSSLTDFERRQAFANAVLEEGEKKFKALNEAAANPYDKLLASLKNVATGGLNVVNVALLPIVELLSKSPTALLTGLIGIAGVLIKQALPAIGEFKAGLQRTAESALQAAKGKAGDAVAAREQLNKLIERKVEASADEQLKTFEKLEKQLYTTAAAGQTRRSSLWRTLKKDIVDISEADIAASERSVKTLEANARKDPRLEQQAKLERATLDQLKVVIDKEDELVRVKQKNREQIEENFKATGQYARVQKAAADFELKARKDSVVANAAYNSSLVGIVGSWQLAQAEIKSTNLKLGLVSGSLLQIRVATATLVGLFATLGGVINKAFAVVGTVAAVFSVLDGFLSGNTKEAEKFNTAMTAAGESINNATRTLDAAKDQDGLGTRTLENTIALSNAFVELTDSARTAIKTAEEANRKATAWDSFWDGLFSLVGKSRDQQLSKTIAGQISSAIELLGREGLDTEFREQLKDILKVQDLDDVKSVEAAFAKLGKTQREAVGIVLEQSKNRLGQISSTLQQFKESSEAASRSYKQYIQSLADTNPLITLGMSMMDVGVQLLSLTGSVQRLSQAFEYLSKNPTVAAAMFGQNLSKEFVRIKEQADSQKRSLDASITALQRYRRELLQLKQIAPGVETSQPGATIVTSPAPISSLARGTPEMIMGTSRQDRETIQQSEIIRENIRLLNRSISNNTQDAIKTSGDFIIKAAREAFQEGAKLIQRALDESRRQAQATVDKALLAGLTGRERAEREQALQLKDIDAQIAVVNSNLSLAQQQVSMVDELKTANLLQRETNLLLRLQNEKNPFAQKPIRDELKALKEQQEFQDAVTSGLTNQLKAGEKERADLTIARNKAAEAGLRSTLIKLGGERKAVEVSGARSISKGGEEDANRLLALQSRINQNEIQRVQLLQSIAGIASEETVRAQILTEETERQARQQQEILTFNRELERLEYEIAKAKQLGSDPANIAALDKTIKKTTEIRDKTKEAQEEENKTAGLQNRQKLLASELQTLTKAAELISARRERDDASARSALDFRAQEVQLYNDLFDVTSRVSINSQYILDLDKARLDNQQAINVAIQNYDKVSAEIQARQRAIGDETSKEYKDLDQQLKAQNDLRDIAVQKANNELDSKRKLLSLTRDVKVEQERYNEALQLSTNIADSLKNIFGDVGTKIAAFGESLVQIGIQNEKNAKALERNLREQEKSADDPLGPRVELIQEEIELRKKSQRDELVGNAKLIGSAKGLFKEKTAAYKALAAIEKVLHIQRIAMDLKELATKIFTVKAGVAASVGGEAAETATKGAGFLARTPIYIAEIFANITKQLGILGPPVAAGIVAAIFGKMMSGGSVPKGFTAEERQQVQGTGQEYVGGRLVDRKGGVLGDTTEKADSITSSIDKLSQEVFGSLGSGSSKIAQALESIKRNTGDTVKALIGGVGALGLKSAFGTQEGSSSSSFFGFSKSSTEIADKGIRVTGSLTDLSQALGSFLEYEKVIEKSSSFWGLIKNTDTFENIQGLGPQVVKSLSRVFDNVQTVLLESAIALEGPTSDAITRIKNLPVTLDVSLKGLKGKEAVEALLAELSVVLNQKALEIFPYVEKYQDIGEELFETVARIVKDGETLALGLSRVGIAIGGLATEAKIAFEQLLLEQLGGVDKAVSNINYYYENFLSNEQRFRIQFNQLSKTFRDAGRTLPQTKKAFVDTLNSLDVLNSEEDRKTFTLLINNAEKYNELLSLQSAIIGDTQQKFKDFAKSIMSFKDSLLLGSATILTPIERYTKAKTDFDILRAKALTGDQDALSKLQGASETFLNVSRELYASGAQYTADFNSVLAAIDDTAKYALEQADIGQQQLSALEDQLKVLINIERLLTPSAAVGTANNAATTGSNAAATTTTTTTTGTTTGGSTVVDNTGGSYRDDVGTYKPNKMGGFASGLSLVGELGPELVDFNAPGRVYTAEQTRGMFMPMSSTTQTFNLMVSELQDLREEVTQLRKEQQRQTGDMIMTNYDAQQKVAEEIVEAVMTSVREKSWQDKSKPTIS
jgi:hypothetical protein